MNNTHSEIKYRGFTIKIKFDEDPRSPREPEQFENLGTLYTAHRRYQPEEDFHENFNQNEVFDGRFGIFKKSFLKDYIALPVYLFDHSGLTVNTTGFSCQWDTSQFGIIAVSTQKVKKEFNWNSITAKRRKQTEEYLRDEIKMLDDYYTGAVYGFTLEDENGEEIDSCWGFYGDECIPQIEYDCKLTVDYQLSQKRLEQIKEKIKGIRKYGKQLFLPFSEFPEFLSEPIIE